MVVIYEPIKYVIAYIPIMVFIENPFWYNNTTEYISIIFLVRVDINIYIL